jgi:hypothetical protein
VLGNHPPCPLLGKLLTQPLTTETVIEKVWLLKYLKMACLGYHIINGTTTKVPKASEKQ